MRIFVNGTVMTYKRIPSLDEEVAGWVVRLSSDQCTRADEAAFKNWLAADPARANAYAECHALWAGIGGLSESEEARTILLADVVPSPRFWNRRNALLGGLGGAAAAGLGVALVSPHLFGPDLYRTMPGEQKVLHLADGSSVILNTNSRLRVDLQEKERHLFLDRGQAFFQVAKDKARPFRVFVGNYEVRALGTAFDVRRIGDAARVTLEEGKVAIYHSTESQMQTAAVANAAKKPVVAPPPAAVLEPGQQAVLASAMPVSVDQVDLRKTEAWRYGQMILDGNALGDIVADLNRYGGPQIVLADPKLADIRVSGVFHTERPDVFVEAITAAFPVRIAEQTRDRIVLASR